MAIGSLAVQLANPHAVPGSITSPAGGAWPNTETISILIVANYNKTGYDHDGMGWHANSRALNIPMAANDKLVIDFTPADPIPITYDVYYRVGATLALGTDSLTHVGSCAGTVSTVTFAAAPDAADTGIFAAAQSSFTLYPVTWQGVPRKNVSRSYNGKLSSLSYATTRIYDAINIDAKAVSVSAANYQKLLKISAMETRCVITDAETDGQILTYTGMFDPSSAVRRADGMPITFNIESETYHA